MTKISDIGVTETNIANVAFMEGERGDGSSVKIPPAILNGVGKVTRTGTLSGLTITKADFDTELRDDLGAWSISNPERFTFAQPGAYLVGINARVTSHSGTGTNIRLERYNSAGTSQGDAVWTSVPEFGTADFWGAQTCGLFITTAAGDYIANGIQIIGDTGTADFTAGLIAMWYKRVG